MDKKSRNMAKRIFAALLAVMLVSGTAVMTPAYKNIGAGVVANAYTGSIEDFNIFEAATFDIDGNVVSGQTEYSVEGNKTHNVTVTVKDGDNDLVFGTDYKLYLGENATASNEIEVSGAGDFEITVEGIGNYEGACGGALTLSLITDVVTEVVANKDLDELEVGQVITSDSSFKLNPGDRIKLVGGTYTVWKDDLGNWGHPVEDTVVAGTDEFAFWDTDDELPEGDDETVMSASKDNIGTAYVKADGGEEENAVRLYTSYYVHSEGSGFQVRFDEYYPYVDGLDGDAWLVTGIEETAVPNGEGDGSTIVKTYVLKGYNAPSSISNVRVEKIPAQPYADEEAIEPKLKLVDRSDPSNPYTLVEGMDYLVEYDNNVYAGIAVVVIKGIGNYYGEKETDFEIMAKYDFSAVNDDRYEIIILDKDSRDADVLALDENSCIYLAKDSVVYSDTKLNFNTKEGMKPYFKDNVLYKGKRYYKYRIEEGISDPDANCNIVEADHTHKYKASLSEKEDTMYMFCEDEVNTPVVEVAKMDIPNEANGFYYGDYININITTYDPENPSQANNFGFNTTDFVAANRLFYPDGKEDEVTTVAPSSIGTYFALVRIEVNNSYGIIPASLKHSFSIKKQPISGKDSDDIELRFALKKVSDNSDKIPATDFADVVAAADVPHITYDREEYTPVISLIHNDFHATAATETGIEQTIPTDEYTVEYLPVNAEGNQVGKDVEADGYKITITAAENGNYTGTREFYWWIDQAPATATIEDGVEFVYGNATKETDTSAVSVDTAGFALEVKDGDYTLVEGTDYTVAYTYKDENDNVLNGAPVNVGNYKVTATFTSDNYVIDSVTADFSITRRNITVTPEALKKTYTEAKAEDAVAYTLSNVVKGDEGLFADVDEQENSVPKPIVIIDGENNSANVLNAGTYNYIFDIEYVTPVLDEQNNVTGYNFGENYTIVLAVADEEEKLLQLVVEPKDITKAMFSVEDKVYNRAEQNANVTGSDKIDNVEYMNAELVNGVPVADFVISGDIAKTEANANPSNSAYADGYKVTVTAQNNYKGTLTGEDALVWIIEQADISKTERFTVSTTEVAYNMQEQSPVFMMFDGITAPPSRLNEDENIVEYIVKDDVKFKDAGNHDFTIVGQGNYKGERNGVFTITKTPVNKVLFEIIVPEKLIYDGTGMNGKYTVVAKNAVAEPPIEIVDPEEYKTSVEWYAIDENDEIIDKNSPMVDDVVISAGRYKALVKGSGANYEPIEEGVECEGNIIEINKRQTQIYPTDRQSAEFNSFNPDDVKLEYRMAEEDTVNRTGVIAKDRTIVEGKEVYVDSQNSNAPIDFGSAIYVYFNGQTIPSVGKYYIRIDPDVVFANYDVVGFDYEPEFSVTPKKLKREMFDVTVKSGENSDVIDGEVADDIGSVVFAGSRVSAAVTEAKDGVFILTQNKDFSVAGATNVVAASQGSTYKVEIWGMGNYDKKSYVVFEYNVGKADINAQIAVNAKKYYDGEPMPLTVQSTDGSMLPAEVVSNVTYTYQQIGEDKKDADGNYIFDGNGNYTFDLIGEPTTTAPTIQGRYQVTATVSSRNYNVTIAPAIFRIVREIKDENISIDHNVVAAYDVGVASFGDVNITFTFDGQVYNLVEGTDYELYGDTRSNIAGSTHEVQVSGINNYEGVAAATWTVTDDKDVKEAAFADLSEKVKFSFTKVNDDVDSDAKIAHGKKRVNLKLDAVVEEGYKIAEQGVLYYNGADYEAGVTELSEYAVHSGDTYLVTDEGNGIHAMGYAVVHKIMSYNGTDPDDYNAYEKIIYTDVFDTTYEDAIRYTTTVINGTVTGQSADRAIDNGDGTYTVVYHGSDMKDGRKAVAVEAPETKKVDGATKYFAYWTDDGEIVSMVPQYSFIVRTREKELEAVYVDSQEEVPVAEPIVTLSASQTFVNGANAVMFTAGKSVPDGYTVTEQGVIYTNNKGLGLADAHGATTDLVETNVLTKEEIINSLKNPAEGIKVYKSSTTENGTYSKPVKVGSNVDAYLYGISFIKVEGVEEPIYSKNLTITTFNLAN